MPTVQTKNDRDNQILELIQQINKLEMDLVACLRRQDMENLPEGAIEYLWDEERDLREEITINNRLIQIIQRGTN